VTRSTTSTASEPTASAIARASGAGSNRASSLSTFLRCVSWVGVLGVVRVVGVVDHSTRRGYPSDLSDEQWALIESLLPPARGGRGWGRPLKHPRREIVDAILYQARTGCSWRQLPGDLPPWSTVYDYFAAWSAEGTKRPQAPIVVDTTGLLLVVLVTAPRCRTVTAGAGCSTESRWRCRRWRWSSLALVVADGGYAGKLVDWARRVPRIVLEIVRKPDGQRGFAVLPRRWMVERLCRG